MLRLLLALVLTSSTAFAQPERGGLDPAHPAPYAEARVLPDEGALSPAYPNPFTSRTSLTLRASEAQAVRVDLFDVLGRRVRTLFEGTVRPGAPVDVRVEASGLPPGLYVVRADGEMFRATRRVTLSP